ncbi:anthranilate O-methyltransferase 3-like [Iris pallida]|uniref:Anthranilate O-methyltransferase 3-like n=1 Tax=Iris pallida TaxID=29817 RepID=A0AAX6E8Y6_IRIPA|nr:anthranilate O-methyltransferase 3-like [Iris pallida]
MAVNGGEQVLHMLGGAGATSYAKNSTLQEKAIHRTKPIVEQSIKEVYNAVSTENLVVADLGCSSSPNTLLVLLEIVEAIGGHCRGLGHEPPEIQYFINDLPGNDFNTMFQYSAQLEKKLKEEKETEFLPYYIVAVPGSFYGRLFPSATVHFFHSSYSLMWLSQVPQRLHNSPSSPLNKGNIYIAEASPQIVVDLYLEQFQKEFSTFLRLRYKELVLSGRMVLTFLGRRSSHARYGELSKFWGLLSDAMNDMVLEGILDEAKVNAFNLPTYAPSMEEVTTVVENEGLFHLEQVQILETNWDPIDDSMFNNSASGENVAKCARAMIEPTIDKYFGKAIVEDLFSRYAKNVAKHLLVEKTKHVIFVIVLRK